MNLKLKENKWLYAFVAACVVLIAAIVVSIVLGVKLSDSNKAPEYTEGTEVGVYYYEVADGEVVLTLSGGNKFTIAGPGMNKAGTYTAEGGTIALDFIREEDGSATATITGETVKLVYGETTMTFIKKVNYTVAFSTDGGSAVNSVSVVNGKTAAKPADPTKDGFVFLGWYADAAFKTAFDFNATAIKADTVVYARWAEKGALDSEYTVSFDLGYEADAMAEMTTIGGKLYGAATPEREGYTFGGWWISMYENAAKLTYAYTEDTVFTEDTTLYAVWYDNASTKLRAPNASVGATSVKWDSVNGAMGYKVVITDSNGTVVATADNIGTTTYTFDFASKPAGEYTVEVTALAANADKNSEAATRAYANKTLDRVTSFTVIDGMVIYNAVEGAEKYYVTVVCGNSEHKHTSFDNGTSTVFNIANCDMQKGGIKITVTASAKDYASSVSKTFVYEKNLDAIAGITYDELNDVFNWTPVKNTAYYLVEVTAGGKIYKYNNGNKVSFSTAEFTGDITIKVTPVTEGYNSPEATASTCKKLTPATPTGITANGNVISWNEAEGATSYIVKVGSSTIEVSTNSYDTSDGQVALTAGDKYAVTVIAVGEGGYSAPSKAIEMGYLAMDPNLTYNLNTVFWTPTIGATNYLVRVNGGETISVSDACSAKITLTKSGVNVIEVRYTDFGGSKWASIEVIAYEVTYMSRSLDGEVTEYLAVGDKMLLPTEFANDGFEFEGWYNTPGAAEGNGKKLTSDIYSLGRDSIFYANWIPKTYQVSFFTEGYGITNIAEGETAPATYTKDYKLPVPVSELATYNTFIGWYTQPSGQGTQLTDENGDSLIGYEYTRDTMAYPFFDAGVLEYRLKSDGTYAVKMGPYINSVKTVKVPETYDGKPVTTVLENAFANCSKIVKVRIPDTIQLIGTGAFSGCTRLTEIDIYEVEGNHERFYESDDGVLIRHDLGTTYLEVVPRAKTGTYVMSEKVQIIRNRAFNFSSLSSVVISKSVNTIASQAFYYCNSLESIDFVEGRTTTVNFEDDSFYKCRAVKSLKIPAALEAISITMLQSLTSLSTITVEKGHTVFGSVGGLLTNNLQNTIVFAPAAFVSGNFTIPAGIQYIGDRAFENCVGLTSVTIPNYVKTIGANAFAGCTNVKTVEFAGDRKQNTLDIGSYAFAYCSKLDSVKFGGSADGTTLDGGAVTIGANAFAPASSIDARLRSVIFGDGANIASIGQNAFADQSVLAELNFGKAAIFNIESYAFSGCANISALIIPATTVSVGDGAFQNCTGITTVTIAEGSSSLEFGAYAFSGCVRLTSIHLPASVADFDGSVFGGCNALKEIIVDEDNENLESIGGILYDEDVTKLIFFPTALVAEMEGVIGAEDLPDSLTTIGATVFSGHTGLKSFTVEAGIRVIGDSAFSGCSNLATIEFISSTDKNATLTIGANAFYNCPFTTVTLPSYVTTMGASVFAGSKFESITLPEKLTGVPTAAFKGNTKLKAIVIPESVSSIGDEAFSGCTKLASLEIKGGETPLTIGTNNHTTPELGAFYNTRLPSVTLPDRVTSVGAYAFSNNSKSNSTSTNTIRSFTAGSGLKSIGFGAFYLQRNLDTVTLNEGLQTIGKYAFDSCGYMSGSTYYRGLRSVVIPSTVTEIGTYAFGGFKGTDYNAVNSVTFTAGGTAPITIAENAFRYSKITTFEIPARATAYVEGEVGNLYGIGTTNSLVYKTFYQIFADCAELATITVEAGSKDFKSIDGVVYTLNENGVADKLLYCPAKNPGVLVDGVPTIVIPNTVVLVENGAFYNTTALKTVIFDEFDENDPKYGQQILYLGNSVDPTKGGSSQTLGIFCGNKNSITRVDVPSHLAFVGGYAFNLKGGSASQDVTLNFNQDAQAVHLSQYAFYETDVKDLALPSIGYLNVRRFIVGATMSTLTFGAKSTFTSWPAYGMEGCANLKTFEVPASVTYMGTGALNDCGIETLTFASDKNLVNLDDMALHNLANLKSVVIPASVTTFGTNMFSGCDSLTSVTLSSNITTLSGNTFLGANALEEIKFDKESALYVIKDGALYDNGLNTLYYFPAAKVVDTFTTDANTKVIDAYAFCNSHVGIVVLPEGLESIGSYAFTESALTSISIPKSVTSIGECAFQSCAALTSFTMDPNGALTNLHKEMFRYCRALTTVTLSDNIETIGDGAFEYCSALTGVDLPAALKAIPNRLFQGANSLESIVIPEGVESIGYFAFVNNDDDTPKIESIYIPASVKTIAHAPFSGQLKLKTITFGADSALESMTYNVFKGLTSLVSVDLSVATGLTEIGSDLFVGATALESVNLSGTQLKAIPANTFSGCTALTTVKLPEDLETIGASAFAGVSALKAITIPAKVANIGTSAFENCTGLEDVKFAEGSVLTALGTTPSANDNIFKNTTSLKTLTLPTVLETIGGHVFENSGVETIYQNNGIDVVTLPSALTSIGDYAFANCAGLTEITILGNTSYVGAYAFNGCAGLESLTISDGVSFIGELAFGYCEKLQAVHLPQSVIKLDGNPFSGCAGITSFTMDENNMAYKFDESGVLYDATFYTLVCAPASLDITVLSLPSTVYEIAPGAFAASKLENVTLPNRITKIPNFAFADCPNLKSVTIANSVTSIGNNAFDGCTALDNLVIPSSVDSIGNYAFANCTSLKNYSYEDKNPTVDPATTFGTHVFYGCSALKSIVLPNHMANKIPDYMYANTGLVDVVVPAQITSLSSKGVFSDCKNIVSVKFSGVNISLSSIGEAYFRNSTIQTIEGTEAGHYNEFVSYGKYSFADTTNIEFASLGAYGYVGQYAFANSSIKDFYFNPSEYYGVACYSCLDAYAFQNCTNIKELYLAGGEPDGMYIYEKNVFDGWQADQTIYFVNDLKGFPRYGHSSWNPNWLDGCNAKIVWQDELFSQETIELKALAMLDWAELASYAGKSKTLNIYKMATDVQANYLCPTIGNKAFNGWTAEQTINFKNYTYQELLSFFTDGTFHANAFLGCSAKVFDKDGNQLIINVESGLVTSVVNSEGTTVYTAAQA